MAEILNARPGHYNGWIEPESAANTSPGCQPTFPRNNCTQTKSGHLWELDDTTGRERIRLQHGKKETFFEMQPNGDEVHKIFGDGYEIVTHNKNVLIKGRCNITINGDCDINIKGDKTEYIEGNYEIHVGKSFTQTVVGYTSIYSNNDMHIGAGSSLEGTLTVSAGDCLYVESDLTVDGEVSATKMTSSTRVDAGTGISAGPLGFVSPLGGISVGPAAPVAIPGCVVASLNSTALVSMNAPTAEWGLSISMWMQDVVNTIQHNLHTHGTPPPDLPFL